MFIKYSRVIFKVRKIFTDDKNEQNETRKQNNYLFYKKKVDL